MTEKQAAFGLVIKDDQILLTLRKDVPVWVLPGGGIDLGETPEKACIREILEETGVRAKLLKKTHELTPANSLSKPTHLFLCEPLNEPMLSSDESRENKYFPTSDLPKTLFWPHKIWIEEALKGQGLIRRPLNEISYLNFVLHLLRHPFQTLRFIFTRLTKS